jgi:hypothetical protein
MLTIFVKLVYLFFTPISSNKPYPIKAGKIGISERNFKISSNHILGKVQNKTTARTSFEFNGKLLRWHYVKQR